MMRTRKDRALDDADRFGFRWGPMDVTRMTEFNGSHALEISTDYGAITVYVSKTGRSIRAFKGGHEMTLTAATKGNED